MKIEFRGRYKSISDFTSDELPAFCIIVGKNGTGKTQLVKILAGQTEEPGGFEVSFTKKFNKIQFGGLDHPGVGYMRDSTWVAFINNIYLSFERLAYSIKLLISDASEINKNFTIDEVQSKSLEEILATFSIDEVGEVRKNIIKQINSGAAAKSKNEIDEFIRTYVKNNSGKISEFIKIAKEVRKRVSDLRLEDFHKAFFDHEVFNSTSLFGYSLENIFLYYLKNKDLNARSFYNKERLGYLNSSIDPREFERTYPSPWRLINNVFEDHNIPYFFEEPSSDINLYNGFEYPVIFKNRLNGREIAFNDLSSGEKIIVGLILKLFIRNFRGGRLYVPDLLVLDEPDAHLHPELTKLLIDVLNRTFVKELGIHVILTTHSPSTVALAPEDCIFELKNFPIVSLTRVSKDAALKGLLSGIPTLSIDYRNHKQVFVESPTDKEYFTLIYEALAREEAISQQLYFISYGYGDGNCYQVKSVVSELRKMENDRSFGIIDWDSRNKSEGHVFVHGECKRYSIENFIFDPFALISLFLKYDSENIRSEFKYSKSFDEYSLGTLEQNKLQAMCDWFFKHIYLRMPGREKNLVFDSVRYWNGKVIQIPHWYLMANGHTELEPLIREVFASLKKFSQRALVTELSMAIAKSYPFVPSESIEILRKVHYYL